MKFYTDIGARDTAFSADVIRRIEGPKTIRSGCEEAPSFHRLVFVQVEKNFQLLEKAHHIASLVIVVRRESNPFQNEVFLAGCRSARRLQLFVAERKRSNWKFVSRVVRDSGANL